MATLYKPMDVQVDGNGLSMAGAKLYFYTTGTSTPQDTFSQSDLDPSHVNPNPVLADANGLWPAIYLGTTDYKSVLKTAGDVTLQTLDPVLVNPAAAGLSGEMDSQFGSTEGSLLERGASAWGAVTFKAVLDRKFGTTAGTSIVRGSGDWLGISTLPLTNSIAADVDLNDITLFFTGPTVAQGTDGTWFASANITLDCKVSGSTFIVKLWDGTTVIDSTIVAYEGSATPTYKDVSLSGFITSPAGNIRVSVKSPDTDTSLILANGSGAGKDSTLTVFRVA